MFTNSSNKIKSDEVSASVTVLAASTADVKGNKTVLYNQIAFGCSILSLQLSDKFFCIVNNIIRVEPEVLQESQNDANSSAKYEHNIISLCTFKIQH